MVTASCNRNWISTTKASLAMCCLCHFNSNLRTWKAGRNYENLVNRSLYFWQKAEVLKKRKIKNQMILGYQNDRNWKCWKSLLLLVEKQFMLWESNITSRKYRYFWENSVAPRYFLNTDDRYFLNTGTFLWPMGAQLATNYCDFVAATKNSHRY